MIGLKSGACNCVAQCMNDVLVAKVTFVCRLWSVGGMLSSAMVSLCMSGH